MNILCAFQVMIMGAHHTFFMDLIHFCYKRVLDSFPGNESSVHLHQEIRENFYRMIDVASRVSTSRSSEDPCMFAEDVGKDILGLLI